MNSNLINNEETIILSIGMIVKNEEKVLRRCLESLKPIMQEIKCELIIADTGSTDNTFSIAKEYTDNVYHFEWIGDFAAARNSTLNRANGIWYMFIDADEYFDSDISHMITFFKTPVLYNSYKSATIVVRNYQNNEKIKYGDARLPRFHRIKNRLDEKVEFVGKIHETIAIALPLIKFETIIHHTGYCYFTKAQEEKKYKRNMSLMLKEYEKNPEDLRLICHIIHGEGNKDKALKYVLKGLELIEKYPENIYRNAIYVTAIEYFGTNNPEKALELIEKFKEGIDYEKTVSIVSVNLKQAAIYMILNKYECAIESLNSYRKSYQNYKDGKLNTDDMNYLLLSGLTEAEYENAMQLNLFCLQSLNRDDEVIKIINKLDIEKLDFKNYEKTLDLIYLISLKTDDFYALSEFYKKSKNISHDKKLYLESVIKKEFYILIDEGKRKEFILSLCESDECEISKFSSLYFENGISYSEKLKNYIENYSFLLEEILYEAVKKGIDLFDIISECDYQKIKGLTCLIADKHDDYINMIFNYKFSEKYNSNIKYYYWITEIFETAVLRCPDIDEKFKLKVYQIYVSLLCGLVNKIYNTDILNDDTIVVLPELHRFGYYMDKANRSLESGDKLGYVKNLRNALSNCEAMKDVIEVFMKKFRLETGV